MIDNESEELALRLQMEEILTHEHTTNILPLGKTQGKPNSRFTNDDIEAALLEETMLLSMQEYCETEDDRTKAALLEETMLLSMQKYCETEDDRQEENWYGKALVPFEEFYYQRRGSATEKSWPAESSSAGVRRSLPSDEWGKLICTPKTVFDLVNVFERPEGSSAPLSNRQLLEKAVADSDSEVAARKHSQLWHDEIFARRVQNESLVEELTGDSISSGENAVLDLFYGVARDDQGYVGIGCVMKDSRGQIVFENRSCVGSDVSQHFAEYTALYNGVAYARSAGVEHINAHGNLPFIYCEMNGLSDLWTSEQRKLLEGLRHEVKELKSFHVGCISKSENQEAIALAKEAITVKLLEKGKSRLQLSVLPIRNQHLNECQICFEKTFDSDMIRQKGCDHRFCFECLYQHAENDINSGKIPLRCPKFYECAVHMEIQDCQRLGLLTEKSFDTYSTRLAEAAMSDLEKVYCPYTNCSALMYLMDDSGNRSSSSRSTLLSAECMECHRLFCVACQVPWHGGLTCQAYQELPPNERDAEDIKLFNLAEDQKWKRCRQCRRMIIRGEGCYHMTCRCGYEFCYVCGTSYRKGKKMCTCFLFPHAT